MKPILPVLAAVAFTWLPSLVQAIPVNPDDPLVIQASLQPAEWSPGQAGTLVLSLDLPPKFHAYDDKFYVEVMEPDGFIKGTPKIQPLVEFFDKFSQKKRKGIQGHSEFRVPIEAPARLPESAREIKFEFTYQACSDTYCLFPITKIMTVPFTLKGAAAPAVSPSGTALQPAEPTTEAQEQSKGFFAQDRITSLLSESKGLALFFVFFAGILTSFTPCIFPMIPITLAVLGHEAETRSRAQNFLLSVLYVLGIAFTYSIMGLIAATSGSLFGASLGNPWILSAVCVLFFMMTLSMYGVFDLQVPAFIRNSLGAKKLSVGYINAFMSGLIAGVVASPCVGPVLVGILAWVAGTGSKFYGFLYLFTYALGLGLIFLVLGAFSELIHLLPRSGAWLNGVKFVLGSLMLSTFYYYLSLLIPVRFWDGALAAGLIVVASEYGAFKKPDFNKWWSPIRKGLMQAMMLIGFGYLVVAVFDLRPVLHGYRTPGPLPMAAAPSAMKWQMFTDENLQAAIKQGKPVLVDFWADWCAACLELEDLTFKNPRVSAYSENFVVLRFDATKDSKELRGYKEKYKIQGLPTVLFFNPKGVWLEGLTLTQFEKPELFLKRMEKAAN